MQCCLNSRLPAQMMPKADQIKFQYRDHNSIPDYIDYNKPIIIDCFEADIDWKQMKIYHTLCRSGFYLCVSSPDDARKANDMGIDWYWGFPITSFYEARAIILLGSKYVKLGPPLFFDLLRFKALFPKVKIRHTPNIAYNDNLPHLNGVSGTWIRPEDLVLYEDYIDVIEFEDCDRDKEQTLYDIYMIQKKWNTRLDLLITNFNYGGINRMVPLDVAYHRLECRQRCEEGAKCRICFRALNLANPELLKEIADTQESSSLT